MEIEVANKKERFKWQAERVATKKSYYIGGSNLAQYSTIHHHMRVIFVQKPRKVVKIMK